MALVCMHSSCSTVLKNDRSSLGWRIVYRENPAWQWGRHCKGKRVIRADRHPWILIIVSHVLLVATLSHLHTSPFLYPNVHNMPVPPPPLYILKCPCLSIYAFTLSCLTDIHLPIPLSNKNKNVWNSQGVSWQAVAHSSPVTQPFSAWLCFCVVSPSFAWIHPHPTLLFHCIFSW